MDKVYSIVRKTCGRGLMDDILEDLDVNAAIWRMFVNTTHQAAVHFSQVISWVLGRSYPKRPKNWSRTRQRPLVYQRLITTNTHGARLSSSQTQCFVWEVLKKTRKRLGRRKLSGISSSRIPGVHLSAVQQQDTSWSRSSRTTRTENLSTSSARNNRISSLTWTAKHLQNSNALIAIFLGSRHCLLYLRKTLKNIEEY